MKRLIVIMFGIVMIASLAHAAVKTATFGDYNSSGVYRMTADSDGVISFASDTNVGIGTTAPAVAVQVGAATIGGTLPASSLAVKGSVEVDTAIYVDGSIYSAISPVNKALCFLTAGSKRVMGYCADTPTNGACTCTAN